MTARSVTVFDDTPCALGEGPLWHPERGQLFWFDILGKRLLTRQNGIPRHWEMGEHASAAGWVDRDRLLVASETALFLFDLKSGERTDLCPLEADTPANRSNDGRVDPWGGFWIGTMGKLGEPGRGAIYRWYRNELRQLYAPMSIPNAICFSPDRRFAYFADTSERIIQRVDLAPEDGWPAAAPVPWLDLRAEDLNPDGAVCDAAGNVWCAQWGAARVACYSPDAEFIEAVSVPGEHSSCPAFGGPNLHTLFVTSARQGMGVERLAAEPRNGMTFAIAGVGHGRPEFRVML